MTSMTEIFGEVISSYTRAQALEDGVLVDLSEMDGAKGHFKYPLACTTAVWVIIEKAVNNRKWHNDLAGVLHDICWMSRFGRSLDPTTKLFQVIIKEPLDRDEMIVRLKDNGVGLSIHYATPVPLMTYYRDKYSYTADDFPNAVRYGSRSISLPVHQKVTGDDIRFIVETMKSAS